MRAAFFSLIVTACVVRAQVPMVMDETVPLETAGVFGPAKISTIFNERDLAISPDGKEIFYSLVLGAQSAKLVSRKLVDGKWQPSQVAPFSGGAHHDIEPAFSADGSKLFFASNRALVGNGTKDHDIWYVERNSGGVWGSPVNVGAPVNVLDADEYYPSVARDGTLYFTARRADGIGGEDIWSAEPVGSGYGSLVCLPNSINSARDEFNAFVDPDEKFVLFSSFGRVDDAGRGDMYISTKNAIGTFSPSRHLEAGVNTSALDYCPYVSPDGLVLFFTSERTITQPADLSGDPFNPAPMLKRLAYPTVGSNIFWISLSKVK